MCGTCALEHRKRASACSSTTKRPCGQLIVIDDAVHIGSANFDLRSLYLNLEMMLRVEDPTFAAMMRQFVDGEIADSIRITRESHRRNMTWLNRLRWGFGFFVMATADYNLARRLNFGKRLGP